MYSPKMPQEPTARLSRKVAQSTQTPSRLVEHFTRRDQLSGSKSDRSFVSIECTPEIGLLSHSNFLGATIPIQQHEGVLLSRIPNFSPKNEFGRLQESVNAGHRLC